MKLNFTEVEEFVPVPPGRYLAEVTASSEGLSKRAGQNKWSMTLAVREDPQHDGEFVDKTIKWDISLQKSARWKVLQTLQAFGEDVSKEDDEFEFDAENYMGQLVTMVVSEENDPTYGKRSRVNSLAHASAMVAGARD